MRQRSTRMASVSTDTSQPPGAWPMSSRRTMSCGGRITDSRSRQGLPFCRQASPMTKTAPSAMRNTATRPKGVFTTRASRLGISVGAPIPVQSLVLRHPASDRYARYASLTCLFQSPRRQEPGCAGGIVVTRLAREGHIPLPPLDPLCHPGQTSVAEDHVHAWPPRVKRHWLRETGQVDMMVFMTLRKAPSDRSAKGKDVREAVIWQICASQHPPVASAIDPKRPG